MWKVDRPRPGTSCPSSRQAQQESKRSSTLKAGKIQEQAETTQKRKIDLRLEKRHWIERSILVMDLSDSSKRLGAKIDGFIGQDVLREFSAVRIDYKAGLVEFEK